MSSMGREPVSGDVRVLPWRIDPGNDLGDSSKT